MSKLSNVFIILESTSVEEVHRQVLGEILKGLFWSDWSDEQDEGIGHLVA